MHLDGCVGQVGQARPSPATSQHTWAIRSRAMYRAMRKAPVQAAVAAMDTTTVPGTTPKIAPAVIVKGMAGTAGHSQGVQVKGSGGIGGTCRQGDRGQFEA